MKLDNSRDERSNFWISYADLMAGLLFIFVLLIGAIVVKYVLTQADLNALRIDLNKKVEALAFSSDELNKKEKAIKDFIEKLQNAKDRNLALSEINALFNEKLAELSIQLGDINSTLRVVNEENKELSSIINLKDEQISDLKIALTQKESEYNSVLADLNSTKERIKDLGGIKLKVISDLKQKLGNSIRIDANSGSVSLPSSILFDTNSFMLKDSARFDLRRTLKAYFDVLLSDEIRPNIDRIVIEGHTDSDGSYLYNLELSQKRAYEVMKFIYSFYKNEELGKYLIASGRSFSDLVYKNGVEDKEASRRIEIKFSISDKATIKEIEKILNQNAR
ncbi:OmpA family protein [Campylobacter fetus]|nr:OmpA family protein [Campylobacter fetus]EJU9541032.1 OmpA family protein [Campylobacter fetus]